MEAGIETEVLLDEKNVDHSLPGKCEICAGSDREDLLLLCDGPHCNLEFHTFCLRPQIVVIPEGEWFCPICDKLGTSSNLEIKMDTRKTGNGLLQKIADNNNVTEWENVSPTLKSKCCVGMILRLFMEGELVCHTGRIIGLRQSGLQVNDFEHCVLFKRGVNGRNQPIHKWLRLVDYSCVVYSDVVFIKLQGSGWWPAQRCHRINFPPYSSRNERLFPSSSGWREILAWKSHELHYFLFGDEGFVGIPPKALNSIIANFRERSRSLRLTQGKRFAVSYALAVAEIEEQCSLKRIFKHKYDSDAEIFEGYTAGCPIRIQHDLAVSCDELINERVIASKKKGYIEEHEHHFSITHLANIRRLLGTEINKMEVASNLNSRLSIARRNDVKAVVNDLISKLEKLDEILTPDALRATSVESPSNLQPVISVDDCSDTVQVVYEVVAVLSDLLDAIELRFQTQVSDYLVPDQTDTYLERHFGTHEHVTLAAKVLTEKVSSGEVRSLDWTYLCDKIELRQKIFPLDTIAYSVNHIETCVEPSSNVSAAAEVTPAEPVKKRPGRKRKLSVEVSEINSPTDGSEGITINKMYVEHNVDYMRLGHELQLTTFSLHDEASRSMQEHIALEKKLKNEQKIASLRLKKEAEALKRATATPRGRKRIQFESDESKALTGELNETGIGETFHTKSEDPSETLAKELQNELEETLQRRTTRSSAQASKVQGESSAQRHRGKTIFGQASYPSEENSRDLAVCLNHLDKSTWIGTIVRSRQTGVLGRVVTVLRGYARVRTLAGAYNFRPQHLQILDEESEEYIAYEKDESNLIESANAELLEQLPNDMCKSHTDGYPQAGYMNRNEYGNREDDDASDGFETLDQLGINYDDEMNIDGLTDFDPNMFNDSEADGVDDAVLELGGKLLEQSTNDNCQADHNCTNIMDPTEPITNVTNTDKFRRNDSNVWKMPSTDHRGGRICSYSKGPGGRDQRNNIRGGYWRGGRGHATVARFENKMKFESRSSSKNEIFIPNYKSQKERGRLGVQEPRSDRAPSHKMAYQQGRSFNMYGIDRTSRRQSLSLQELEHARHASLTRTQDGNTNRNGYEQGAPESQQSNQTKYTTILTDDGELITVIDHTDPQDDVDITTDVESNNFYDGESFGKQSGDFIHQQPLQDNIPLQTSAVTVSYFPLLNEQQPNFNQHSFGSESQSQLDYYNTADSFHSQHVQQVEAPTIGFHDTAGASYNLTDSQQTIIWNNNDGPTGESWPLAPRRRRQSRFSQPTSNTENEPENFHDMEFGNEYISNHSNKEFKVSNSLFADLQHNYKAWEHSPNADVSTSGTLPISFDNRALHQNDEITVFESDCSTDNVFQMQNNDAPVYLPSSSNFHIAGHGLRAAENNTIKKRVNDNFVGQIRNQPIPIVQIITEDTDIEMEIEPTSAARIADKSALKLSKLAKTTPSGYPSHYPDPCPSHLECLICKEGYLKQNKPGAHADHSTYDHQIWSLAQGSPHTDKPAIYGGLVNEKLFQEICKSISTTAKKFNRFHGGVIKYIDSLSVSANALPTVDLVLGRSSAEGHSLLNDANIWTCECCGCTEHERKDCLALDRFRPDTRIDLRYMATLSSDKYSAIIDTCKRRGCFQGMPDESVLVLTSYIKKLRVKFIDGKTAENDVSTRNLFYEACRKYSRILRKMKENLARSNRQEAIRNDREDGEEIESDLSSAGSDKDQAIIYKLEPIVSCQKANTNSKQSPSENNSNNISATISHHKASAASDRLRPPPPVLVVPPHRAVDTIIRGKNRKKEASFSQASSNSLKQGQTVSILQPGHKQRKLNINRNDIGAESRIETNDGQSIQERITENSQSVSFYEYRSPESLSESLHQINFQPSYENPYPNARTEQPGEPWSSRDNNGSIHHQQNPEFSVHGDTYDNSSTFPPHNCQIFDHLHIDNHHNTGAQVPDYNDPFWHHSFQMTQEESFAKNSVGHITWNQSDQQGQGNIESCHGHWEQPEPWRNQVDTTEIYNFPKQEFSNQSQPQPQLPFHPLEQFIESQQTENYRFDQNNLHAPAHELPYYQQNELFPPLPGRPWQSAYESVAEPKHNNDHYVPAGIYESNVSMRPPPPQSAPTSSDHGRHHVSTSHNILRDRVRDRNRDSAVPPLVLPCVPPDHRSGPRAGLRGYSSSVLGVPNLTKIRAPSISRSEGRGQMRDKFRERGQSSR